MKKINLKNLENSEDILFYNKMAQRKVLFVCLGNTCRSIMAQSIFEENCIFKNAKLYSAGILVSQKNIEENTEHILTSNFITVQKTKTNRLSDYKHIHFDDIIILDKSIKDKELLNIKYKRKHEFYISDPFNKDIEAYSHSFIQINLFSKKIN